MNTGLASNIKNFYVVEAVKVAAPLVTLPILLSKVSLEDYGTLAVYIAFASIFSIVIDGNLNYSFINRCSHIPKSKLIFPIVWRLTLVYRGMALTFSLAFGLVISFFNVDIDPFVLFFFIICTGIELFIPVWYFQFLSDLKLLSVCTVISKFVLLAGVVFFVDHRNILYAYPALLGIGHLLSVVILSLAARNRPVCGLGAGGGVEGVGATRTNVRDGWGLFLAKILAAIYTNLPLFLLQSGGYMAAAGALSVAVRVTSPVKMLSVPVVQGLYPLLSAKFGIGSGRFAFSGFQVKLQALTCFGSGVLSAVIFLCSGLIVDIFHLGDSPELIPMIQLMCLIPPVIVLGNVFGFQNLAAARRGDIIALVSLFALAIACTSGFMLNREALGYAPGVMLATELTFTFLSLLGVWWISLTRT